MADESRSLRYALIAFGIAFLLVYPLMIVWPSGWAWTPSQHEYEQMIVGIYATLGVFLLRASRQPESHLSLIWFTVWSSVVHGGIMAVQAVVDPTEHGHLPGDVAALFLVAGVLAYLTPRGVTR
jgi:FtsH-binding integral membrane protein